MNIQVHGTEETGFLAALQNRHQPLPFDVKRVFYIFGVPEGGIRGGHAHREGDQFFICLAGGVTLCQDTGKHRWPDLMEPPSASGHFGVFVPAGRWVDIIITAPNTILLCLCSNYYDEDDYIRDREQWVKEFSAS